MKAVTKKSFVGGQLCSAHPPTASLGCASHSYDYVTIIHEGEVRVLTDLDAAGAAADGKTERERKATKGEARASTELNLLTGLLPLPTGVAGPTSEAPVPPNRKVEAYLSANLFQIASLGPTECVFGNLLGPDPEARWCLEATTPLSVLVLPLADWREHVPVSRALLGARWCLGPSQIRCLGRPPVPRVTSPPASHPLPSPRPPSPQAE